MHRSRRAPWKARRGNGLEWHTLVLLGAGMVIALGAIGPLLLGGSPFATDPLSRASRYAGWIACAVLWVRAIPAYRRASSRARLVRRHHGHASLAGIDWSDFERLVGEVFRRWGYHVEETGLGGADGGIDLRLRKHGELTIVQCKHWKARSVGAPQVREMFGLMVHHNAQAVVVVTSGKFTREAVAFGSGKPIELIDGHRLSGLIARLNQ